MQTSVYYILYDEQIFLYIVSTLTWDDFLAGFCRTFPLRERIIVWDVSAVTVDDIF